MELIKIAFLIDKLINPLVQILELYRTMVFEQGDFSPLSL